jgi:hypothetical protein
MLDFEELSLIPEPELARVDPVLQNLTVARGIDVLAGLDIPAYQALADEWAADIASRLPALKAEFWKAPQDWRGDVNFFRLGVVCWYVDMVLGVRYCEDQRDASAVEYTEPSDLFLNGVMDSRRGTCASMPVLHVALAWRLGWPVSLARAGYHLLARYDDGQLAYNIATTNTGSGGFGSPPDEYYVRRYSYSNSGVFVGVDLRALQPREVLGCFVGLRARHFCDTGMAEQALADYNLAHRLYPANRLFSNAIVELQYRLEWNNCDRNAVSARVADDVMGPVGGEVWVGPERG